LFVLCRRKGGRGASVRGGAYVLHTSTAAARRSAQMTDRQPTFYDKIAAQPPTHAAGPFFVARRRTSTFLHEPASEAAGQIDVGALQQQPAPLCNYVILIIMLIVSRRRRRRCRRREIDQLRPPFKYFRFFQLARNAIAKHGNSVRRSVCCTRLRASERLIMSSNCFSTYSSSVCVVSTP